MESSRVHDRRMVGCSSLGVVAVGRVVALVYHPLELVRIVNGLRDGVSVLAFLLFLKRSPSSK